MLCIVLTTMVFATAGYAQTNKTVTDYLNVPGPINFEKKMYQLNWSSHPASNFYKQEYIAKGDIAGKYKTMLLFDVIVSDKSVKDIAGEKIAELKKIKETNPIVNYEIFDNPKTGEYMIDFLLSANTPDGKQLSIVERNVYRYKTFTDKSGRKGILLFGVSTRSYGNGINNFLISLKANKKELINEVAKYTIPEIAIVK